MDYQRQRGYAKGPCPGCKKGERHPAGGICAECTADIERGREASAVELTQDDYAWYAFSRQPHWNPGYYLAGVEFDDYNMSSDIGKTFTALALSLGAGRVTPDWRALDGKRYKVDGPLLRRIKHLIPDSGNEGSREYIRVTPAQADALNALDRLMCKALWSATKHAFAKGSNLLKALALGDLTLNDFNDAVEAQTTAVHKKLAALAAGKVPTRGEEYV